MVKLSALAFLGAAATAAAQCDNNQFGCPRSGYCAAAPITGTLPNATCVAVGAPEPCYQYDNNIITDCNGADGGDCRHIGDGYCDDGTFFDSDLNCTDYDYDGGDCDVVVDCDGNMALLNLYMDGTCHDGSLFMVNFDCVEYDYDGGDCAPKNCDGTCIDAIPTDDGTCQEDFNCKKFEYSFEQCIPPNICPDDFYDLGRPNYRCSQRTGGERFTSKLMVPFDECECYDYCAEEADLANVDLVAFDHYSDKCRCWTGECSSETTIECKGSEGKNADDFLGDDGRCPAAVYFPHERTMDCHPAGYEQDVTMYVNYFYNNYYNDGYCDNAEFGRVALATHDWGNQTVGDYDCATFNDDGEDCLFATCDEIFEITQFAVLDDANLICDGHNNETTKETEWTTACDCYEFCAPTDTSIVDVVFQRDNNGMCQCIEKECVSQSSCGLESDCQIFSVERIVDCCGDDWTLGKAVNEISLDDLGDFSTRVVTSIQALQRLPKVISYEVVADYGSTRKYCVPEFMCTEHEFSFGTVDGNGDMVYSPCLSCGVTSQTQLDDITTPDKRCDKSSNDAIRFLQLNDYYLYPSLGGVGRTPYDMDDYCGCEVQCKLEKFNTYSVGACPATEGIKGYYAWLEDPSTKFAVDSYKGDCRCWDFCTNETVWTCTTTIGGNDRCAEGDVAVVLWAFLGAPVVLPSTRPNGGIQ